MRNSSQDSNAGWNSMRRSEDVEQEKLLKCSKKLYALTLLFMLTYVVLFCLPTPPSTSCLAFFKALPCLTLSLNAFTRYHFGERKTLFTVLLSVSFIFHALGDYLLQIDIFTVGLASFLIAHLLNVCAFITKADENKPFFFYSQRSNLDSSIAGASSSSTPTKKTPLMRDAMRKENFLHAKLFTPFLAYLIVVVSILLTVPPSPSISPLSSDPVMTACVIFYGLTLASCPWRALVRRKFCFVTENQLIWTIVFIGYCIYASSDTILSIDKFTYPLPEPARSILVMSTYWIGQLLISTAVDAELPKASILSLFFTSDDMSNRFSLSFTNPTTSTISSIASAPLLAPPEPPTLEP
ncbi:hypothetical protein TrCOL_g9864 [Triparma columacea]|uniref:Uncharacterized protein n=1 Tax=Triparma columacea TaxID=722753 RepID=A0A9W7GK02_9STRA|nr:hypothetical protein TrCOL_g9864 [Triparma columacea]